MATQYVGVITIPNKPGGSFEYPVVTDYCGGIFLLEYVTYTVTTFFASEWFCDACL